MPNHDGVNSYDANKPGGSGQAPAIRRAFVRCGNPGSDGDIVLAATVAQVDTGPSHMMPPLDAST
jgi:hypothetical protein